VAATLTLRMVDIMSWAEGDGGSSPARLVNDGPYRVIDLGDGTAMFQLDVEASWSAVLEILKTVVSSQPETDTSEGPA
jgi:hypothetical protein